MSKLRRLFVAVAAGGALLVGVAAVATWRLAGPELRLGMKRAKVEHLLGQAGREYHVDIDPSGAAWRRREYPVSDEPWEAYYVWYSPDEAVIGGCHYRPPPAFHAVVSRAAAVFGIHYDATTKGHPFGN